MPSEAAPNYLVSVWNSADAIALAASQAPVKVGWAPQAVPQGFKGSVQRA